MARPEFKPTKAQRERVASAAGGGMPHEHIAIALGICRATLEKHFTAELTVGAYAKRAEVIETLRLQALKGSVPACRAYLAESPDLAAPEHVGSAEEEAGDAVASEPLGKKAQAEVDAKTAQKGTSWEGLLDTNVVALRAGK